MLFCHFWPIFACGARSRGGQPPHPRAPDVLVAARRGAARFFLGYGLMVGRREPGGIGPCPPLLPLPPACWPRSPLPHSPLPTAMLLSSCAADSLWRGAEGLGARARGAARRTGAGPTSALPPNAHRRSTAVEVAAAPHNGGGGCPAWWLGCPSLTDAVWSGLQEVVPLIGAGFFTLDGSLRRTLFPRARRAESENFPNARAPPGPRPRLRLGQGGPRRLLARCFGHHHRSR